MNHIKTLFSVIALFCTITQTKAQLDCICPQVFSPVCAVDSTGNFYIEFPNACYAECYGYSIIADSTLCQGIDPWGNCDCPEPDSTYVCAQDSFGNVFSVPNSCYAECWGLTVVEGDDCNTDPWENCDCPEPDSTYVCAQDSFGNVFSVPNSCYAVCWGLTVVEGDDCNTDPWGNCNCPEPDSTYVCAQDSFGNVFSVPNSCYAECWGLTVVEGDDCNTDPWGNCNCPEPDSTYVCAQDSFGNVFSVPNSCYAECWGLTVVEGDDCNTDPWGNCNCIIDENATFICAQDSMGHACYVPNQCYADCLGLTVVDDSLCSIIEIDPEINDSLFMCINSVVIDDSTTFQQALLQINAICNLGLPECILDAPVFDTDEEFITYIIENCDGNFGLNDNGGSNVMNLYNTVRSNALSASKDITAAKEGWSANLITNPAAYETVCRIVSDHSRNISINLTDINGRILTTQTVMQQPGSYDLNLNVSSLPTGLYLVHVTSGVRSMTLKLAVIR